MEYLTGMLVSALQTAAGQYTPPTDEQRNEWYRIIEMVKEQKPVEKVTDRSEVLSRLRLIEANMKDLRSLTFSRNVPTEVGIEMNKIDESLDRAIKSIKA